jgi:CHAT domain-containing protein
LRTQRDGGPSVVARTVSSYIPTLDSLRRARGFTESDPVRQLTVATPGPPRGEHPELRHVSAEMEHLARHFPLGASNHQLVGPEATCGAVIAALASHEWIHLACHAGTLESIGGVVNRGFALWDADLTMNDLAAQPARQGGLAFLSACQTATGTEEHRDEALHLAAAMQFIGYSRVVATMWSIKDSPAPLVAESFYETLAREGRDSASALRAAIMSLRTVDPTNPFLWAPYAHYGH